MNILHINCNYMTTSLHQTMIEHLDKYTSNQVFCPILKGKQTTTIPNSNVTVSECFSNIDRILYFNKQRKILTQIEKSHDICSFELIHAYTLFTDGNCAMKLSQKYDIPYVVAVRDTDMNDFFRLKPYLINLGIKIMENASMVFFLSDTYKKRMLERYVPVQKRVCLEKKMMVIPNGIDDFWLNNQFSNRNISEIENCLTNKQINVVCVGQIIKRKNIPFLQNALAALREEGWTTHLDVIGKAIDGEELKRLQADQFTDYHAPLPKEKLIDLYRKNDIFILISHTETFGLVYAEAMSQGLPVIYTRGQGFDGQFEEGFVGYAVSDHSVDELVNAIKSVCVEYKQLSENALQGVIKFDWHTICKTYFDVYSSILKSSEK